MAYELDKKRRCNGKVVKKEREGRKLDEDHQRAVEAHALVLVLVDACCIGQGAFSGVGGMAYGHIKPSGSVTAAIKLVN